MDSGADNAARYFGAAVGITLFVVIATHVGDDLAAGWNVAVLVSTAISLVGAAVVAIAGGTPGNRALSSNVRDVGFTFSKRICGFLDSCLQSS